MLNRFTLYSRSADVNLVKSNVQKRNPDYEVANRRRLWYVEITYISVMFRDASNCYSHQRLISVNMTNIELYIIILDENVNN